MANPNIRDIMQNPAYRYTQSFFEKVFLAGGLNIQAQGAGLSVSSNQIGNSLLPRLVYDDLGYIKFVVDVPGPLITDFLVQPDENFDKIAQLDGGSGKYRIDTVQQGPGTVARIVDKFTFKGGSVVATTDATVTFYATNNIGQFIPENEFFSFTVPAGQWPSNFQEYSVATGGQLGFFKDEEYGVRVECDTQFSQRYNAAQTLPWQKEDHQLVTEFECAFANVPFATYKIPVDTVFPTVGTMDQNVWYPIDVFTVKDEYNFTLNPATGEYTYNGISGGNYDGTFYMFLKGSAQQQDLEFRLIKNGAPIGDIFNYEISSAETRSATVPTEDTLNNGDTLSVEVRCINANAETITFKAAKKKIRGFSKGAPA